MGESTPRRHLQRPRKTTGLALLVGLSATLAACSSGAVTTPDAADQASGEVSDETVGQPASTSGSAPARFTDVSGSNLPVEQLGGQCMDATTGDVDGDGDPDLVLAQEHATNLVLINDGEASFTIGSLQGGQGDNEDVRLADLDGDGDLDLVTVHEDDQVHSVFENDGSGSFTVAESALPADLRSTANALELHDLDRDGDVELLIGNAGTNLVMRRQPDGSYLDATRSAPIGDGVTQDLLLIDVDGDDDQDLFVVNEALNHLLINRGDGTFDDETHLRLPGATSESRQAAAADLDDDGDLDIVVANVAFNRDVHPGNQLLINDGNGFFTDATVEGLRDLTNAAQSFTVELVDVDADGDTDILSADNRLGSGGGVEVWSNRGDGTFEPPDVSPFSEPPSGSTFDIEVVDLNGDGELDLYFCNRTGTDQLYLSS